ncbi:MAG: tRNA (cytidine(34)-2'-O)-methyltransferase [Clostridia bacterium]|nr:tRNA (cytidine(34)-2'-O)-methyltransferase [Clostridia bacterium]
MKLNVVLYHPEIPQNTGNIMRSCVGFNAKLHIIKPIGFNIEDKKMLRSALDYYEYVNYEVYENYDEFKEKNKGKFFFLTRYGHKSPSTINFKEIKEDIYLAFGAESTGIAYDILKDNLDDCYRIPITDKIRSLNLSNCAAIMLFLASEQVNSEGVTFSNEPESMKGKDFLENVDISKLDTFHKDKY